MNKQKTTRKNPGYFESMKRLRDKYRDEHPELIPTWIDPRMTDFVKVLESSGNLVFHICYGSRYFKPEMPPEKARRLMNFELYFIIRYSDKRFFSAVMQSFCGSKYLYHISITGCGEDSVDVRVTSEQLDIISDLDRHLEFQRIIHHVSKAIGKGKEVADV